MLLLPSAVRILLAVEPTDMRNSIDGLAAVVKEDFREDVFAGHLFVFLSRRRDRVKILTWDNGGFIVFYKRLEQGRFRRIDVSDDARVAHLDGTQLAMLLDGIDVSRVRRPKKWNPPPGDRLSQQSLISTARWQSDARAGNTTASGARSTPRSRPTSRP